MRESGVRLISIAAAFAASVAIHIGAAAMVARTSADARSSAARPHTDDRLAKPGISEGAASTVTWIGFQDPTPHAAPLAETDQAQVSPDAGEAARRVTDAARQALAEARERVAPALAQGSVFAEALRDQAIVAARRKAAEDAAKRAAEAAEARQAAEGNLPAIPDERDAVATSSENVMLYQAGQPLARQGLQIATVRPKFDAATLAIERPRGRAQPVVRITFNRDGTVRDVAFVDGGTGMTAIDEPIKTAVYRWTASGSDLEALPDGDPDASLSIRIRFDL